MARFPSIVNWDAAAHRSSTMLALARAQEGLTGDDLESGLATGGRLTVGTSFAPINWDEAAHVSSTMAALSAAAGSRSSCRCDTGSGERTAVDFTPAGSPFAAGLALSNTPTFNDQVFNQAAAKRLAACAGSDLLGWGGILQEDSDTLYVPNCVYIIVGFETAFSLYVLSSDSSYDKLTERQTFCKHTVLTQVDVKRGELAWTCTDDFLQIFVSTRWTFMVYRAEEPTGALDAVLLATLRFSYGFWNREPASDETWSLEGTLTPLAIDLTGTVFPSRSGTYLYVRDYDAAPDAIGAALQSTWDLNLSDAGLAGTRQAAGCDATGYTGPANASTSAVLPLLEEHDLVQAACTWFQAVVDDLPIDCENPDIDVPEDDPGQVVPA